MQVVPDYFIRRFTRNAHQMVIFYGFPQLIGFHAICTNLKRSWYDIHFFNFAHEINKILSYFVYKYGKVVTSSN